MQDAANQKRGCVQLADRLGMTIDGYITDDGVSGAKDPKERQLGKLLKRCKKGDTIIASEISRLGRDLYMIMRILEHLYKNGISLYTVKDNFRLSDDIQSKVLAFAFGLSAEIERKLISQRTKEALARKKAEGVHIGRPMGRKSDRKDRKLYKHEDAIRRMVSEGVSLHAIALRLKTKPKTLYAYYKDFLKDNDNED